MEQLKLVEVAIMLHLSQCLCELCKFRLAELSFHALHLLEYRLLEVVHSLSDAIFVEQAVTWVF